MNARTLFPCVALAMMAACTAPSPGESQPTASPSETAVGTGQNSGAVFIARRVSTGAAPMAALFGGSFAVRDGCLMFDTADGALLPVFTADAEVSVEGSQLKIGTRQIPLGSPTEIGGGERAIAQSDLVDAAPEACDVKRFYIGS